VNAMNKNIEIVSFDNFIDKIYSFYPNGNGYGDKEGNNWEGNGFGNGNMFYNGYGNGDGNNVNRLNEYFNDAGCIHFNIYGYNKNK